MTAMLASEVIAWATRARRVTRASGVPCSLLGGLFDDVAAALPYVPAYNEGDAIAYAVGAWLAGGAGLVLMQNSGLGNAVNPLASIAGPAQIPVTMVIGWRGREPDIDEPQHAVMGSASVPILNALGVAVKTDIQRDRTSGKCSEENRSAALLIATGPSEQPAATDALWSPGQSESLPCPAFECSEANLTPESAARACVDALPAFGTAFATTGYTARLASAIAGPDRCFAMAGGMGCIASVALGFAMESGSVGGIVVMDGDGALLMRPSALAMIGLGQPDRFVHVVFDNEFYDSTGGQPTYSGAVCIRTLAWASGYRRIETCSKASSLSETVSRLIQLPGPSLVYVKTDRFERAPPRLSSDFPTQARSLRTRARAMRSLP